MYHEHKIYVLLIMMKNYFALLTKTKLNCKQNANDLLLFAILILIVGCNSGISDKSLEPSSNIFIPNILNLAGVPNSPEDRSVSSFCDLGSWHAFALPSDSAEFYGGFIGPFTMYRDNGIWLGKKFAHLTLYDINREKINFTTAAFNQFPGYLEQKLTTDKEDLEVILKLWYQSNNSIMVSANILNSSKKALQLYCGWKGDTWLESASFHLENQLNLSFTDSEITHNYLFDRKFKSLVVNSGKSFSNISENTLEISPNSSQKVSLRYSFFSPSDHETASTILNDSILNESYQNTLKRWEAYLAAFPYREGHWLDSLSFEVLKSKAIQTLVGNWKSAAGELKYDGLFPSYLYKGFHGFWAWDSWKHAVALSRFEPELAKSQVLAMFSFQNEQGMIPDCIFRDTLIEKHNWRDTKPPLATWAVNEIFEQTNDTFFVAQMFPKLLKYHNWWYSYRDNDKNGLCEYGSTDGTKIAAAWESGMDNAVRFDNAIMVKNKADAWSFNQESVDLNTYLVVEKKLLAKLAKITNNDSYIESFHNEAQELSAKINAEFYDTNKHYYFDRELTSHLKIDVIGPEGWLPLWGKIASASMAESVKNKLFDKSLFYTKVPLPTLNISHQYFDPEDGYWRGPVWLDQAYFAIVGLENYGYVKEANDLKLKLVKNAEGLLEKGFPIRENYHPISGKGLNANHFSWSAAHLLLLIE